LRPSLALRASVIPGRAQDSPGGRAGCAAAFDLRQQLGELIGARAFLVDAEKGDSPHLPATRLPRTREEFHARRKAGEERIGLAVQEVDAMIGPLLQSYHEARLALDEAANPKWRYAVEDVRLQLAELAGPRFLSDTPWPWLLQYRRYFQAIVARLKNLVGGGIVRDRQKQSEIEPRWLSYLERARQHREMDLYDPQLDLYHWMLEEYRVSLFAQKLGTAVSVSPKRLEQQWANVRT
jgi:ATP-dependent helicase HrpA